jgi:hypothetical protein
MGNELPVPVPGSKLCADAGNTLAAMANPAKKKDFDILPIIIATFAYRERPMPGTNLA